VPYYLFVDIELTVCFLISSKISIFFVVFCLCKCFLVLFGF
jgi:hypothetical protein